MVENKELFNNFSLRDDEILHIINKYSKEINRYCYINYSFDEDLKQEIILEIYKQLTKNRKK